MQARVTHCHGNESHHCSEWFDEAEKDTRLGKVRVGAVDERPASRKLLPDRRRHSIHFASRQQFLYFIAKSASTQIVQPDLDTLRQMRPTSSAIAEIVIARTLIKLAKLPFRYRWMGCQPNLVGAVPFLPLLPSSAQHMRALVAAENLRNSPAATGSSY